MKKKKNIITILIFVTIISIIVVSFYISNSYKTNYIYNENLFNIERTNEKIITQGNLAIYDFQEEMPVILDNVIAVQILNPNDVVVGYATVKNNRILVDTSPLSAGNYRIKILYDSQEMIVEDSFTVILIAC